MFKSQTQKQIEELEKLVSVIQDIEKQLPELVARKEELQNAISEKLGFKKIESTNKKEVISNEVLEVTKEDFTQTKEKIEQKAFRYFLKDESMKGVQSAQITKLAGKKPTWIRAGKNADKDWYVSAIGTKSDDVEKYMMMLPNMTEKGNKYFNRSEWKAKYWRGQK